MGHLINSEINQYLVEACYEMVKRSQLWPEIQNFEADRLAEELAKVVGEKAEAWIEEREVARLEGAMSSTDHLMTFGERAA